MTVHYDCFWIFMTAQCFCFWILIAVQCICIRISMTGNNLCRKKGISLCEICRACNEYVISTATLMKRKFKHFILKEYFYICIRVVIAADKYNMNNLFCTRTSKKILHVCTHIQCSIWIRYNIIINYLIILISDLHNQANVSGNDRISFISFFVFALSFLSRSQT